LFSPEKLLNKKIWDVSPDLRHLTRLESINRLQSYRQNAANRVAFMPNNPFRINASERKNSHRAIARQVIEIKQLVFNIARREGFDLVNTELGMRNFCWRQSSR
jgi:hypothetical protein